MSRYISTLILLSALTPASAQIVVPNSLAAVEGNLNNRFPFLVNAGQRYQQVYAASQFPGPIAITQIAFRPDGNGAIFSRNLSSVQISLSTTAANPDGLSATFANNVGSDNTIVYAGPLALSSANLPGPGNTRAFDIVINLQSPFIYNPVTGNLLMDVLNSSPENNSINIFFDADTTTGDSISRVNGPEGQPASPTGTVNTSGLVTRFVTIAVPEPAVLSLLGLATLGLLTYCFYDSSSPLGNRKTTDE